MPSLQQASQALTVYLLPFFYGAITRLPFIYFVIHMRFAFEMDWNRIGLAVGAYQGMRVVTSICSIAAPRLAHFLGTAVALMGNILVLTAQEDDQTRIIAGTILVGSGETFAAMQTYVKKQFEGNFGKLEYHLKLQYASVMVGVTVAFLLGGVLYEFYAMHGVAWFGAVLAGNHLVSLVAFFFLDHFVDETAVEKDLDPTASQDEEEGNSSSNTDQEDIIQEVKSPSTTTSTTDDDNNEDDGVIIVHIDTEKKNEQDLQEQHETSLEDLRDSITAALDSFSASGMGANYLSYALCVTFGMEAITIGYNLAVSPVYILEVFHHNTTVIGILLAAGAAFGTMCSISIALSKRGMATMEAWLPSPANFIVAMSGISLAVLVAAVPIFPIHVIGLLLLMGFNDLAALLLNEMQGAITSTRAYATLGPMGQVIRRSGNVLTAISGSILFGIMPQLPYIVAGTITTVWTVVITLVIRHRMAASRKVVQDSHLPEAASEIFNSASFARKEVLARQVKKGHV